MMGRLALLLAVVMVAGAGEQRSGREDASPETRAMQDDDAANPAFLWVRQGEALWSEPAGASRLSCAGCHGEGEGALRGVAARYPVFDARRGRLVTLEDRINLCRVEKMGASVLAWDDERLIGLAVLVGSRSRGMEVAVEAREPFMSQGAALFRERMGQLNLSCAQCHDGLAGQRLAGSVIPQGHANGYPEYRLEWQGMGVLYRRLRNCMTGVRAEPFAADSPEVAALTLYLMVRAKGMTIETPAVRP